ncbi:MAG: tyrosine-type recombinase/integrase [Lachnospiraceae bacterium]|nr:tyrosine-type recombinase/integrase [Lachnospiraceae bacterium]
MFKNYDLLVKNYLANMESNELSPRTIESYALTFRLFRESMERNGFEEATPAALSAFKNEPGRGITTKALYLTHLRLLSDYGVSHGYIEAPFYLDSDKIPSKKVTVARQKPYEHVLTEADMVALITAERPVYGRKPATWLREKAEVTLMVQSGLRNLELRTLRPCDLDWENGVIYPAETKGDKARAVAFPAAARNAVREYLESGLRPVWVPEDAPLFGNVGSDGTWKSMERHQLSARVLYYTNSILGEEKACRTHAARHCYASVLLEHGVDMQYISESLGHASTATTKIYAARFNVSAPAVSIASVLDAVTA